MDRAAARLRAPPAHHRPTADNLFAAARAPRVLKRPDARCNLPDSIFQRPNYLTRAKQADLLFFFMPWKKVAVVVEFIRPIRFLTRHLL
jgi:hypothetical protein